jgi:hypothetical protein
MTYFDKENLNFEIAVQGNNYGRNYQVAAWRNRPGCPTVGGKQRVYNTTLKRIGQLRDAFSTVKAEKTDIRSVGDNYWWVFENSQAPAGVELILHLSLSRPLKSYHERQT